MTSGQQQVMIPAGAVSLPGTLRLPPFAGGLVILADGGDGKWRRPCVNLAAEFLSGHGIAALIFDFVRSENPIRYETLRDVRPLGERLMAAAHWARHAPRLRALHIGLFGDGAGAAAVLYAAAQLDGLIAAIVSRAGRVDLAGGRALRRIACPALFIVGARDELLLELNRAAFELLPGDKALHVVAHAGGLLEEVGTLLAAAQIAHGWFARHFSTAGYDQRYGNSVEAAPPGGR
ncbi:MAG: alpha/beta hydrolase [Betaproteobacteria bacterium]|nr:alpha/beta hydrolase [Betaproteobacteria bacterium]